MCTAVALSAREEARLCQCRAQAPTCRPVESSVQLRRRQWRASVQRTRGPCCESPAAFSGLRERRHGVVWLVFHSRPWQARGLSWGPLEYAP